jgi:hypothetical protein
MKQKDRRRFKVSHMRGGDNPRGAQAVKSLIAKTAQRERRLDAFPSGRRTSRG